MKANKIDVVLKLSELLEKDESFRLKFESVMAPGEKLSFQVMDKDPEGKESCHCYPYLCGKGCFGSYTGAHGYLVG